jgi:pimeloyl-[acyl-carrier protein] synthase
VAPEEVEALLACRPDLWANPYPIYHRLRATQPVYPTGTSVLLTRYADVAAALRDRRMSSNRNHGSTRLAVLESLAKPERTQFREMMEFTGLWMLLNDPPDHTRLRGLANQAFTARRVAQMRERIQGIVDDLLDAVAPRGAMDAIADLAAPLPVFVIAELVGISREGRARMKRWSDVVGTFLGGLSNAGEMHQTIAEFRVYLLELAAQRRFEPHDDLLTGLVQAEEERSRLSEEELLAMCVLLLVAGHETTTHVIGNGLLTLLRHPDQLAHLRDDPALIQPAVEELLRYESPLPAIPRVPLEDVEIGGTVLPAGVSLDLLLGAANRDPDILPDPDRLDITQQDNKHLAFAHGPHFCLGAPLARLEAQVTLGTLVRRFSQLQLAAQRVQWLPLFGLRGLTALPVTWKSPTSVRLPTAGNEASRGSAD